MSRTGPGAVLGPGAVRHALDRRLLLVCLASVPTVAATVVLPFGISSIGQAAYLPIMVLVVAVAALGGAPAGLAATALGATAGVFGSAVPAATQPGGWLALGSFLIAGTTLSLAFESSRRTHRRLETERRRLQADLDRHVIAESLARQNENHLREADRHKNEFLAMLSHELRHPLVPILNATRLLQVGEATPQDIARAREIIDRQAAQLTRLIDDLLDVSRISRGELGLHQRRVELADVLETAVESSLPLIQQRGHDLDVTMPVEAVHISGDLTRLIQVFSNLLNNAAKYTDHGGRIQLTAARREQFVEVYVRDTGVGIPPEQQPFVFDLFFQGHRAKNVSGLGIGLTLAKQLIELHGGEVAVHSDGTGTGSEFRVRLPVAPPLDSDDIPEAAELYPALDEWDIHLGYGYRNGTAR